MATTFKSTLEGLLKTDARLTDENGELHVNLIRELANQLDEQLLELLLNNDATRERFFVKVKDVHVFRHNDFKFFLDENKLDNSYTQYENKLGLSVGSKLLRDNTDVVLNFPYKDCVLEGGQSTEEGMDAFFEEADGDYVEKQSKRKEIFFNEVLARDEIDRLFDSKAFTNITKYSTNGTEKPTGFTRNAEGTITDNLLIKGNNLLALHSLKQEFKGNVKLIYIDPPYNTGSDSFKYNDNFNHSTWLAFMKNRLEIAMEFLSNDGVIFINIDDKEYSYLKVLCDDEKLFKQKNFLNVFSVKTSDPSGHKTVNPSPYSQTEYILMYAKDKSRYKYELHYVPTNYDKGYNQLILNPKDDYNQWQIVSLFNYLAKENGYNDTRDANTQLGKHVFRSMVADFALKNRYRVYQPTAIANDAAKDIVEVRNISKNNLGKIYKVERGEETIYIRDGRQIYFYANKVKEIDGELTAAKPLTNLWSDIPYNGIAKEGGVKLKNGKKPEKLLRRLIDISTKKGDTIMDFHVGSGTTAAVAHKMGRQYIGIEQLDYGKNDSVQRLQNVINGDSTGISKAVNWNGGGSFVYLELAKNNEQAKEQILACNSLQELMQLFDELYDKFFLHYNVRAKEFKEKISKEAAFVALPLSRQQEIFCRMLDLNQLYVNASEMEDSRYSLPAEDIVLTKAFYQIAE